MALLLEVARVLRATNFSSVGVDYVFFDGKEFGRSDAEDCCQGSRYFARMLSSLYPRSRPSFAVIVDMIGDCQQSFLPETASLQKSPRLVKQLWQAADDLGYQQYFQRESTWSVAADQLPLQRAGIPAALLIDNEYAYWHTHQDTPDKVCASSLERVGKVILRMLAEQETDQHG